MSLEFVSFTNETREILQKIWSSTFPDTTTAATVAFGLACNDEIFPDIWNALVAAVPWNNMEYVQSSSGNVLDPVFITNTPIRTHNHPSLDQETQLIVFLHPEGTTLTEFMTATNNRLDRAGQLLEGNPEIPLLPNRHADFASRAIRL